MAFKGAPALARGHLPQLDSAVRGSQRDELAVRREGHSADILRMAIKDALALARGRLPQPDSLVIGSRRDELAVR